MNVYNMVPNLATPEPHTTFEKLLGLPTSPLTPTERPVRFLFPGSLSELRTRKALPSPPPAVWQCALEKGAVKGPGIGKRAVLHGGAKPEGEHALWPIPGEAGFKHKPLSAARVIPPGTRLAKNATALDVRELLEKIRQKHNLPMPTTEKRGEKRKAVAFGFPLSLSHKRRKFNGDKNSGAKADILPCSAPWEKMSPQELMRAARVVSITPREHARRSAIVYASRYVRLSHAERVAMAIQTSLPKRAPASRYRPAPMAARPSEAGAASWKPGTCKQRAILPSVRCLLGSEASLSPSLLGAKKSLQKPSRGRRSNPVIAQVSLTGERNGRKGWRTPWCLTATLNGNTLLEKCRRIFNLFKQPLDAGCAPHPSSIATVGPGLGVRNGDPGKPTASALTAPAPDGNVPVQALATDPPSSDERPVGQKSPDGTLTRSEKWASDWFVPDWFRAPRLPRWFAPDGGEVGK